MLFTIPAYPYHDSIIAYTSVRLPSVCPFADTHVADAAAAADALRGEAIPMQRTYWVCPKPLSA